MIIKYRARGATLFIGVMWFVFSITQLFLFINSRNLDYPLFISALNFIALILGISLSILWFTIQNIDYLRLENGCLSLHHGFPLPREKIMISTIEKGNIVNDRLVLMLKDEKQVELKSKFISVEDFEKLKKELSKQITIESN